MNHALFSAQNDELDKKWERTPNTPANLDEYRHLKKLLLEQIVESSVQSESSKLQDSLYKLGVTIACQIVKTQVVETTSDGYRKTELSLVTDEIRDFCVRSYDQLLANIRQYNPMYIPDILERTAPDRDKRIAIFRLYDIQNQRAAQKKQENNKNINKLFGSRG